MKSTRRTQPYRKSPLRPLTQASANMQRGKTVYGYNPQDLPRLAAKKARRRRRRI